MSNLAYNIIYPQPRKLTLGLVLALTLFTLTVNAQTVVRTGTGGAVSGNDIGAVQKATGAAEGDVIKVSDGAAFNTDVTDPVSGFTIESSTGNVVNVPVQAGYNFPQIPAAPVNAAFRNVSFTGAENYTSHFWRGDLNQNNIIGITIDGNVSFSNFKDSVFDYYLTSTENEEYFPYKFTCTSGSSLTFSGNKTEEKGAAIVQLSELNGNSSFMTFSGNTANSGGAIYTLGVYESIYGTYLSGGLTGNNNQLTFSNNKANGTGDADGGGAIYSLGDLSGSGNTLDFSENTASSGGAIGGLRNLSGSGNKLEFSENTAQKVAGQFMV